MKPSSASDPRIASLISAYADRAPMDVDPMMMTRVAASSASRRSRPIGFMPAARGLAFTLLLLAALVTLVAGALTGGRLLHRDPDHLLTERAFVEPFTGLAPEGVAPSTPETGELVLSFHGRVWSAGLDFHRMWVYADGRLIWKSNLEGNTREAWRSRFGASEPTAAVIEQRLTPEGVELLRSELMSTAIVGAPNHLGDDATEWGIPGVLWGGMTVRIAEEDVAVEWWSDPMLPGRLATPGSWLPASAWADQRIGAYVPARYAVCLSPDESSTIDRVPEPARTLILANGTGMSASGGGEPTPDCLQVTTDAAREIVAALDTTGLERVRLDVGFGYRVRNLTADSPDMVRILPIVPHGEVVCSCG